MVQLQISWTDWGEIWYEHNAIGDCPKIVFHGFLQSVITARQANKLVRWRSTLAPLGMGQYNDVWLKMFGKYITLV
jgi:hypothetical protein